MAALTARAALVALAALAAALPAQAGAQTDSTAVTIPGSPLSVYVGPLGECQSSYIVGGEVAGNYFYGGNKVGDCGFFLGFPSAASGQPPALKGKTFGFDGAAGPHFGEEEIYEPVSQSAVTGSGTEASPYSQTTVFAVKSGPTTYAEITEVTTYVNGAPQFQSTYTVKNVSGSTLHFRAMYAGDLYVNGSDVGIGIFQAGPPRFIGGQNTGSGVIGGFLEVTPWSSFQEAYWDEPFSEVSAGDNGIWHDVQTNLEGEQEKAFNETVEAKELDNGAGVEWDAYRTGEGLKAGGEASFAIINRTQIPNALHFGPANQTLTQGQTATVSVTADDTANQPYAGRTLRYTISGANPQSGSVVLNAAGQAQISYVGNNPGADTVQMYVDLGGSGTQTSADPSGTATVNWLPKPTPDSSFRIAGEKVNANGTITITFVPTQGGTATLEVTVPTASIAKKKKCKKGKVLIKGKCRPASTVSGRVSATGTAGVPLTLRLNPSSKVKSALKRGRTVKLTATLTYRSALGGAPTVQVFHFTVKPHKKKHH